MSAKSPKPQSRVALREDEGQSHSKIVMPLIVVATLFLVVWPLSKSNSLGPLRQHSKERAALLAQKRAFLAAQALADAEDLGSTGSVWEREGWDEPLANGSCRSTYFVPFKTGCPISCCGYRSEAHLRQQPMYRFQVVWDFGKTFPEMHDYEALSKFSRSKLEQELNLTATTSRTFAKAESLLTQQVSPLLKPKMQNYVHLALSYFCCLTDAEVKKAVSFAREWIQLQKKRQAPPLPFRLERLECWKERLDSVTTIFVADPTAQRALKRLENQARYHLQQARNGLLGNIMTTIPSRTEQMPYHLTLLGLAAPRETGTFQPGNVSKFVPELARAVEQVNQQLALASPEESDNLAKTKQQPTSMLNYADMRTTPIACHANCDIDHS